ncbi:MAG: HAMP domain-containing sensor histidine kinase [Pseudomonadota bacterium]
MFHLLKTSVSARLVFLIVLVILLVEILLMVPSTANYRQDWFRERIEAAYLVGLALESPSGEMIEEADVERLLATADIKGVMIERDEMRLLIKALTVDPQKMPIRHFVDLREKMTPGFFSAPWAALFSSEDDLIRVTGYAKYSDDIVDILVAKSALRRDLKIYTQNILGLSLLISILTACLVYWRLNRLIVKPVKALTENMIAFERDPEEPANILTPSGRRDEFGAAETGLINLESRLQALLGERERLAALGAGISKISHDLRNVLASAQLMSDRLAKSDDPRVKKLAPRLISALDRAIGLSRDTLSFARMEPSRLNKETLVLRNLVDGVFDDAASMHVEFENDVDESITIKADQTHLYRTLFNLVRNAVDALTPDDAAGGTLDGVDGAPTAAAGKVTVTASLSETSCQIRVIDNGPGIPEDALAHLFEPFKGSMKPGGSGLGVAIAHEISKAHGGRLLLTDTGPDGTVFTVSLPTGQTAKP